MEGNWGKFAPSPSFRRSVLVKYFLRKVGGGRMRERKNSADTQMPPVRGGIFVK